jgi:hypothetical protein
MSFAVDSMGGYEPRPGEITERGVFVPPWYEGHKDLSLIVTHEGKSQGYTVGEVAVERRWAIEPDGSLMEQSKFERGLQQWRFGQFDWQVPPVRRPDLSFDPVPAVRSWVARGPDPADGRRLVDLTFPIKRNAMLKKREVIDDRIMKDPRWRAAPVEEDDDTPEPPTPAPKAKKKATKKPRPLVTCDECGKDDIKGAQGLRLHKMRKHPAAAETSAEE